MGISATSLAFSGLGVALIVWVFYLRDIAKNSVSQMPVVSIVLQFAALAAAVAALVQSPTTLVVPPSGATLMLGGLFLFLLTQRKTPVGDIKVKVGDALLPFAAKNSDGTDFDSSSLADRRILLKFFRGSWWPYCSAELRRFEAMEDDLAKHGVTVVAISKDSVEDVAMQVRRDKISFPLLSDPDLSVIRQFGLEHHKALEFSTGRFALFGIPLALVPSVKTMAIPTSMLLDEKGVIRWIDQADDYRLRSNEERVMEAVHDAFAL